MNTSNTILIKNNVESDQKRKQIAENINNLMEMLIRILKNDKIKDLSYEKIYSYTYKICTEKAYIQLYDTIRKNLSEHLKEIYQEIENYFFEFEEISDFAQRMIENYNDFIYKIGIIQKTLLYYEKNFLEKQTEYEDNIKKIANNIFFAIFINDKTISKLVDFIMGSIEKDRKKCYIDKILLRNLIGFFLQIQPKEHAYKVIIEQKVIKSSIEFYRINLFEKFFKNENVNLENKEEYCYDLIKKYFIEIKNILNEEDLRFTEFNLILSRTFLIENILESLLKKVIHDENAFYKFLIYMINFPERQVISMIKSCLDHAHLNTILSDVPKNNEINIRNILNTKSTVIPHFVVKKAQSSTINTLKDQVYERFASALENVGKSLLEEEKAKIYEKMQNNEEISQKNNIDAIILLIDRLMKLIENIEIVKSETDINNNKEYTQLIHSKLVLIVNNKFQNSSKIRNNLNITKNGNDHLLNINFLNISKNLAIHIDYTLKNYSFKYNYDYIINYFEKIILLVKFLEDKDIFEINNRKLLCQRILLQQNFNEDLEMKLINKLKLENGTIFTFRSEIMIKDIKNSVNVMDNYRSSKFFHRLLKEFSEFKNIDYNYRVLTQGSWLINTEENIISKDLLSISENKNFKFIKCIEQFDSFYKVFFPGKLLKFNLSFSNCELYSKLNGKNYQMTTCCLQALILLSFYYEKQNKTFPNPPIGDENMADSPKEVINKNQYKNEVNRRISNKICILKLFSIFNKINKNTFIFSLLPLIKMNLIKIVFLCEENNQDLNSLSSENKRYVYFSYNLKESKISLTELLTNYFSLEKSQEKLNEHLKNKTKPLSCRINFNIKTKDNSISINSFAEFTFKKILGIELEINTSFASKQQRLRINYPREKEKKTCIENENQKEIKENDDENETIKIERKYQIESNIIRIMKYKKLVNHQELINETLTAMSNYFVPNISMIKLRIENLIERGFISRDTDDYNKYIYST